MHHLRETLNAVPPEQPFPAELFAKYDAPVIASTVKLWTLELDPPLGTWEGWDDIRRLYPSGEFALDKLSDMVIESLCSWFKARRNERAATYYGSSGCITEIA